MKTLSSYILICASVLFLGTGCDKKDNGIATTSFTVKVENVSTPGTIPGTMRAGGAVPLSPGAWAVFSGNDPLFTIGQLADEGTERIAEDGVTSVKDAALNTLSDVKMHGVFQTTAGPLLPGDEATFNFTASQGDKLQFESMFVQSNDWFYSFSGGGLELFNGDKPVSGDQTVKLELYDAGTEEDTPPGEGPDQKPVQATDNQGPTESEMISSAGTRHPTYTIPATTSVIKITITPN